MYARVPLEELEDTYTEVSREIARMNRVSNPCTCLKEFCDAYKYHITFRFCNNAWWCFFRLSEDDSILLTTRTFLKNNIVHAKRAAAHEMIMLLKQYDLWDDRLYRPGNFDTSINNSHRKIAKAIARKKPQPSSVTLNMLLTSHRLLSVNYFYHHNIDGAWACTCVVGIKNGDMLACNASLLKGEKAKNKVKEAAAKMVLEELCLY